MKPKLLFHSNAPWAPTGYGNQCGLFTPRLIEHYDVQVSAFYGLEGAPIIRDGVMVLPGLGNTYGNETLPAHARRLFGENLRDGLVVTLMDVWVLHAKMCSQFDMACWVPVDHDPAPTRVTQFFRESQAVPLAMSRFGMERLAEFDPIYVPHAVDTTAYKPMDRRQAREQLGIGQDDFVVGMVAANKGNPSRKSFATVLEAFAELYGKHENARLCLHTDITGEWTAGMALGPMIDQLGLPEDAVRYVDPYTVHFDPAPPVKMRMLYSAFDVLASPSMGEGFGIPILEAQACGTPAVVTDFSAMSEVCGAGWKVGGQRWWTPQNAWQVLPDTREVADALEDCYLMPAGEREKLSVKARAHALSYDIERVMGEYMLPGLEAAHARLQARRAVLVPVRAAA